MKLRTEIIYEEKRVFCCFVSFQSCQDYPQWPLEREGVYQYEERGH